MSLKDFQLFLIRVYIGLDFSCHFAAKFGLLGPDAFDTAVAHFHGAGFPTVMVIFAGVCEFAAFAGFTFGIFTRVTAVFSALYLVAALFLGAQDRAGFGPSSPGGAWEYPALWMFVCLSYGLTGGGRLSVDAWLRKRSSGSLRMFSA